MTRLSIFAALLVVVLLGSVQGTALAQTSADTLYIPGSQSLQISNIINADTLVTYRVYVLDRGAIYYIDRAFEINRSCKFIAKGASTLRPPVLAPAIRADGSSEEWFFKLIKASISVELNDLYLLSMRSDGQTLGWSRAIHIGANRASLKMRRVVFDAFTEAAIRVDGAQFVKLDVQDCHFRNFIHSTAYFGGQPFLSGGLNHPDTTKFINNTFFACNSYIFSIRGYDPYSVFEHNTIVYGAVNPFLTRQASNLIVKNNLFYAAHAWGGDPEQLWGTWFLNYPDSVSSALLPIRIQGTFNGYESIGPEGHVDPANGIDETYFVKSKRRIIAQNNAYHFPAELVQFYNTWNDTVTVKDSVTAMDGVTRIHALRKLTLARWLNDLGVWSVQQMTDPASPSYSPLVSVTNNTDADPNLSDVNVKNHVTELVSYVRKIASRKLDNPWHYELNFPPKWPIPENLAYTNGALLQGGTDGFPVGDLNWFPDKKAEWEKRPTGFTITVDGNKDPFFETLTGPNDGYLQIKYYGGNDNGNPYNNADLSAKVWTAWDTDWFYLYEEVMDDTLAANHASNVWEEDCLELKFDAQPKDSVRNSVWDTRLTALGLATPGVLQQDSLNNVAVANKQWARKIIPGGYALELAIKWSAIGHNSPETNESVSVAVDSVFGLAIGQHDNDGRARRQASVEWAAVMLDAVWNTPKYHGTVKFLANNKLQFIPTNNVTGRTNPIPYDGTPFFVAVDGTKDRVYNALRGPNDGYLQIRSYANNDNGLPVNDADLSAKVWTAWDDTWFYLYEEVRDDTLAANHPSNVWEEDCLELKFDAQPKDSVRNSVWDTRLTALGLATPGVRQQDSLNNVAVANKQWARKIISGGYALELAIKWSAIGHNSPETNESVSVAVDSVFGLAIGQHDNDGRARRQASVEWAAVMRDAVWNTPKYHGTVKFLADNKLQFIARNNMTGRTNIVPYDGSNWAPPTSVEEKDFAELPLEYSLSQNYPNPFNPATQIRYSLKEGVQVSLRIYNVMGNLVTTLVDQKQSPGNYSVLWDGRDRQGKLVSTGIYFYKIQAGSFTQIRKMVLVK